MVFIIGVLIGGCIIGTICSIYTFLKKEAFIELSNFLILENYVISSKIHTKELDIIFPYLHREILRFSPRYEKYFKISEIYDIYSELKDEGKLYYYDLK